MLIDPNEVRRILAPLNISGVLHVGAHDCEELSFYETLGIDPSNILWIDAAKDKIKQAKVRNLWAIHAAISNIDEKEVTFHAANNGQSSSLLELGTHAESYPHITYTNHIMMKTTTIDTLLKNAGVSADKFQLWNLDIQGVELLALRGGIDALAGVKAIYTEVNTQEVYKGCALIEEIDEFLVARGFTRVLTHLVDEGWGDAIYVH